MKIWVVMKSAVCSRHSGTLNICHVHTYTVVGWSFYFIFLYSSKGMNAESLANAGAFVGETHSEWRA